MIDLADLPRPVIRYAVGVWRRRWTVVVCAWAAALLGWFGVWLLPNKYESRAQVFVQTETILEPVMSGVTARPNYERRVDVMRQQLLSRPNVEEIVYRAGLDKSIKARSDLERRVKMEKLIDWVRGEIKISSPQEMYFDIAYRFGEPVTARNVVDAVVNLLIEQDLGASLAEKEEARRLLDIEIANFDQRLTAKEREVAEFRRANAGELSVIEGNARRSEAMETDLARISEELGREQRRVSGLRDLLATTPRTSAGSELDQLKVQLAQLRSQYQDNYPDIQVISARIRELESGAALPANPEYRRLQAELTTARGQVEALAAREQQIRADLEALAFTLSQAPGVSAELSRIQRDYDQMQKSYEELVHRRDRLTLTTNLGAGGQGVEYRVFERPTAALSPVAPPRFLLALAALVMALGAGVAAGLAITYFDKTFTQPADLQEAFGLTVLGAVSNVPSQFTKAFRRADRLRLAGAFAGLFLAAFGYIYWTALRLPKDPGSGGAQAAHVATTLREAPSWD